jgi:hypothetical protein
LCLTASGYDIWTVPLDRPAETQPLLRTEFNEVQGFISPDGSWLAYTSDESSRLEVYVQPMLRKGRKWQISVDGGSDPRWRGDGRELFFLGRDLRLYAVDVHTGIELEPGTPHPLFKIAAATVLPPYLATYDVDATGRRFLVRVPLEQIETQPLHVLVPWSHLASFR